MTATTTELLPPPTYFTIGSVLSGEATLDNAPFRKGDHFVVPAGYGPVHIEGNAEFIFSSPT